MLRVIRRLAPHRPRLRPCVGRQVWSAEKGEMWTATAVWTVASIALLCAGLGLLRAPVLRRRWKAHSSPDVCIGSEHHLVPAAAGEWSASVSTSPSRSSRLARSGRRFDSDIAVVETLGNDAMRHPWAERVGWSIGIATLLYAAVVMVMRPVFLQWGTTPEERRIALAGDQVHPVDRDVRIDHAITDSRPCLGDVAVVGAARAGSWRIL